MSISLKADPSGTFGEILVNGQVVAKLPVTGNAVIPNLVGTVSESGGIPTGAIVERGNNVNGEYVRFADGTQICTAFQSFLASADTTWTYPAAFGNAAVRVILQYEDANRGVGVPCVLSRTTTVAVLAVLTSVGARRDSAGYVIAIGRWY